MKISPALVCVCAQLVLFCRLSAADAAPIFPEPQQWRTNGEDFALNAQVRIVVPRAASESDLQLARFLAGVVSDRDGVALRIDRVETIPTGVRAIVMGSRANPLVSRLLAEQPAAARAEGYTLRVTRDLVLVAGDDDAGTFYGLQSLRQLIHRGADGAAIRGIEVRDWPLKPFRGIKIYLPGREHIPFFKRFVRDFMALYKFNKIVIEMNAAMRFERHPELNAGWIAFANDLAFSRRDRPEGPHGEYANSTHYDTGDGAVLEKAEVAELVRWCEDNHIEVIPEIPSLTHSYYLLTRHRELAEIQDAEWPDTYCPSNPKSYELLFDVFDEFIEVMKPKMIHVGHDEWRMPIDACALCKGKNPAELFAQDLNRIHDYLARKNIRVAIYGDHFIEPLRGQGTFEVNRRGRKFLIPGALSPEQVEKNIPKDILIFNWFWGDKKSGEESRRPKDATGEVNDVRLEQWGFEQVYGTFKPGIEDYARRSARRSVIGGVPCAWAGTTEFNFGKDLLYEFLGSAPLVWSSRWMDEAQLAQTIQGLMPEVRRNFRGVDSPRRAGEPVVALPLPVATDTPWGHAVVVETQQTSAAVPVIPVGEDPSSIVFLHACAKPAGHEKVAHFVFNHLDASSLLGWYEVVYADGFVATVPIRYGWNVLETNWPASADSPRYCYAADVSGADAARAFAFEWINPRFGKAVKEIRVRVTTGATDLRDKPIPANAIILRGVELVRKRSFPAPGRATASP